MSKNTKRKYIESHWLVFAIKGAFAAIAGLCLNLSFGDSDRITRLLGYFMLFLGIAELINVFHRSAKQHNWGIPLAVACVELFVAATMLVAAVPDFVMGFFPDSSYSDIQGNVLAFRLIVLSCYTLYASVASIFIAFTSFENKTDRFIWLMEGMFGAIMAFAMLGENGVSALTHLRVFGVYLLVKGLTDMIFAVHSKEELDDKKAADAAKKLARKASKK